MEKNGGLITQRDLTDFAVEWQEPVSVSYRGHRVFAPPPPCQAVQYLETLNIMEGFDVAAMGHNRAATLHRFIEAAKLAQADRAEFAGIDDPPTAGLLSKAFADQRRAEIGAQARPCGGERYTSEKMADEVLAGDPRRWMRSECTTHFSAIDAAGNAVAVTQSLGAGFGSAVVIPGTGIALNNFLYWMDSDPQSPNAVGPGRKLEMCMSPAQVWDDQGLRFLIGTPGSYGILQTTPQMIMNVIDHGMNIQAAIEAPRVKATSPGTQVGVETRIGEDVLLELTLKGHRLNRLGPWAADVGGGQGIMVDPESGGFMGGADPRRDGYALGW
jgi:gamma-glutamyltranspeptidase/glutathione hydrolase